MLLEGTTLEIDNEYEVVRLSCSVCGAVGSMPLQEFYQRAEGSTWGEIAAALKAHYEGHKAEKYIQLSL